MSPKHKKYNWLLIVLNLSCLAVVLVSFYFFYFKKSYDFLAEFPCDATKEECFYRDCTNPDDCPPNGLSDFKRYSLKASDFKFCPNEDCSKVCADGTIKCAQVKCVENLDAGESCVSPATNAEENKTTDQ